MGVCEECINLTNYGYNTDCYPFRSQPCTCSYNFAGIPAFQIEANLLDPSNGTATYFLSTADVPRNLSKAYLGIGDPIASFAQLKMKSSPLNNQSMYHGTLYWATLCGLTYCVQSWRTSHVNKEDSIKVFHQWTNNTPANQEGDIALKTYKDIQLHPTPEMLELQASASKYDNTTYTIAGDVAYLIKRYLETELTGTITTIRNGNTYPIHSDNGNSFLTFLYHSPEDILDAIAWAMTLYMHQATENYPFMIEGYAIKEQSMIEVRWSYTTLPSVLLLFTVFILLYTTLRGKGRERAWKTSALAVLFHGLGELDEGTELCKPSEMEELAKRTNVQLDRQDEAVRLIVRNGALRNMA